MVSRLTGSVLLTCLLVDHTPRRHPHAGGRSDAARVFWIGLAFAHAILLRELPHGEAS